MKYLEQVLGIDVQYENIHLEKIPNYISARYDYKRVSLNRMNAVFLYPKTELEQVITLKKHLDTVKNIANCPVVIVLKHLTSRQKEYLIREKIAFIVDGKQIYLPFMATYLQERCDAQKITKDVILPSAQLLLLHFIYKGAKEMYTSQAAKDLSLTPMSISRASRQLENMGILKVQKNGVQKKLLCEESPKELFNKSQGFLLNPVKKTVYVQKKLIEPYLLKSGYSALSEYSFLNTPNVDYFASDQISKWNNCMSNNLLDSKTQVAIELWRYNPKKLSKTNIVDELSLALSLREVADERVEETVEEMLNNLWREIDGNRN
ncbi:MAG: hypothetical protein PUH25_04285 [Spirochaetales bacterium]|nr:hypothetical protein [Spirochaetales bacterium]